MLVTVAKTYNVWVVQVDELQRSCFCFWWHASNMQQEKFPSTVMNHPEVWASLSTLPLHIDFVK